MTEPLFKPLGRLIVAALAIWVLLAVPARRFGGESVLLLSGTAMILCLIAAVAGLVVKHIFGVPSGPRSVVILAFMGIRPVLVLGMALLLALVEPAFHTPAFCAWLAIFYMAMLVRDVAELIIEGRSDFHTTSIG